MKTITSLDGVANFRDVGGLRLQTGGQTRSGVLYRSADLSRITGQGLDTLSASDIGVIVDLRTVPEREFAQDQLPTTRHFAQVEIPLLTGNLNPKEMLKHFPTGVSEFTAEQLQALAVKFEKDIPTFASMYQDLLLDGAEAFAAAAKLTAQYDPEQNNAVLVHCTAGKDRTGIACALILDAVGVNREDTVANYALSQQNLAGPWAESLLKQLVKMGIPLVPQLVAIVTTTPPTAMETALKWVDANFGSSAEYLKSGGITDSDLEQLTSVLTA